MIAQTLAPSGSRRTCVSQGYGWPPVDQLTHHTEIKLCPHPATHPCVVSLSPPVCLSVRRREQEQLVRWPFIVRYSDIRHIYGLHGDIWSWQPRVTDYRLSLIHISEPTRPY